MSVKRIQVELKNLMENPIKGVHIIPNEDDVLSWIVKITGPAGTPYEKGTFSINIVFTSDFPFKPPKILFKTKIYHPNFDSDGNICLSLLNNWKPASRISVLITAILQLLLEPNLEDPIATEPAELYRTNKDEFIKNAKDFTKKYAK
eukprot:NODE_41_length_29768_cov_0.533924.p16 type:complete len:147 gc:universal NODE_41_length_29768_cov_0.533924:28956-29396(+)